MVLQFRNVTRYVRDLEASVPMYEALGFVRERAMGGMVVLRNEAGVALVLHAWDDAPQTSAPRGEEGLGAEGQRSTALGFTMTGPVAEARRHVEAAGFRCLREPEEGDAGFFFVYGDLDGNPINLVGQRPPHGPPQ